MPDFALSRTLPPVVACIGSCSTCGKASYTTRRDARRAGKAFHPDKPTRVYRCGALWHVTTTKRRPPKSARIADDPGSGNTTDAPGEGIDLTEAADAS